MADFNMTVTASGLKLLTDALAGTTVTLTGIHLGSGSYSGILSAATQLDQEEIVLPLERIIQGNNQITAKSVLQYRTIETGFTWTEIGLFAKEADGPEILYAYGYAGNKGDYIPGSDETTLNEKVIRFTVLSSNDANIVAEVDGSTVYASQEDLDDLRESIELSITNITNVIQQVTGVDPSDPDAEPPSGSMVVTLTHSKSGTVHQFTGLEERTGLVPCQFKSTAGYSEGDTATIDGTAYTITLTGADAPETDLFVSGKSIIVDVDTESKTINFKAGGGLTKAKLALANATEDTVFNGRTFYARDKTMRTGRALATATNVTAAKMFAGTTAYNQQGQLITGNPGATNVTAAKMFTGTTAYDRYGNWITGAPTATTAAASDIAVGKTAYTNAGVLLTGTGRTVFAGSIQPTIEYKTYTISYPSGITSKPRAMVAYINVWIGQYATPGQQPSFSPYYFRGAASGQLNGITTAVSGTMRNQNQSSANTEITISNTSFSVTFSKYDYIASDEFCYILIW